MAAKHTAEIWQQGGITTAQKLLLLAISENSNTKGEAIVGFSELSRMTGMCFDTLCRHLKSLETQGFVVATRLGPRPSHYQILTKPENNRQNQKTGGSKPKHKLGTVLALSNSKLTPTVDTKSTVTGDKKRSLSLVVSNTDKEKENKTKEKESFPILDVLPTSVVFEFWAEHLDHPRARLGKKRAGIIARALKSYSIKDLLTAIRGCKLSPFHQGDNERGQRYDDLELILRDESHIEKFMGFATAPPQPRNSAERRLDANVDIAKAWVDEDRPIA